jgi:putative peptidoglycan lipid II flippase
VILGAVLFLLVQIPGLIRFQFRWTPAINLHHPGVKQVLGLLGPRILTVLCIQINYIAQDNIASRLVTGSVTALVYGWLFMQVPETIIGTALGTALLPTLSEQIVRREQSAFQQVLNRALRLILALTIPIAVLISVTIQPVVGILGFDPSGTSLVTWSARAYLLGLMGHSLLEVSVRAFYAQQNARTPLLAAGLTTAAFIFLAILLAPRLGAPGIALANAIAFTGEAFFLWFLLNRRFPGILKAGNTLARVIPAAFLGGVIAYAITGFSLPALPQALFALTAGGLIVLPFIRPELRVLIKL